MTNALVFAVLMYGLIGLVSAPSYSVDHCLLACATALVYFMYKEPDLDAEFRSPAERAAFMAAVGAGLRRLT